MTDLVTGPLPPPDSTAEDFSVSPGEEEPQKKRRGRPPGTLNKSTIAKMEVELADRITEYVALPLGMVSPLGAAVLDMRAERTAKALTRIAATSPRMARALKRFIEGSAWADVTVTGLAVVVAIGVDMRMMEPDSKIGRAAKIPEAWAIVYPDEPMFRFSDNGASDNVETRGTFG